MRFDKPIVFVLEKEPSFNEETGDYDEAETIETKVHANVNDTATEMSQLMYSSIKTNALTVRLHNAYNHDYSYLLIDGIKYQVDKVRRLRNKMTLFVSEVL